MCADELSIRKMIIEIRGVRVILDRDIAKLYGVTTGNLNKAVKRNMDRFPERYMFQLSHDEFLLFQNGISSWGGTRTLPYAFTEQGVAMFKNIELQLKLLQSEQNQNLEAINDLSEDVRKEIADIYQAIAELSINLNENKSTPRPKIGFKINDEPDSRSSRE